MSIGSLGLILLLASLILYLSSIFLQKKIQHKKTHLHLHQATINYNDLIEPEENIFSKKNLLAGRPDYILNSKGNIIPVEVKKSHYSTPAPFHLYQLATYCQLLEDTQQRFVPYGVLVYADTDFEIPFDPQLRFNLEKTMQQMRKAIASRTLPQIQIDTQKCQHCSYQNCCSYFSGSLQKTIDEPNKKTVKSRETF